MAKRSQHQTLAAWIFGSSLLLYLMIVFVVLPDDSMQHPIIHLFGSLLAGLLGYFLTGSVRVVVDGALPRIGKVGIQALGGGALFVLVFLGWTYATPKCNDPSDQSIRTGDIHSGGGDVNISQERTPNSLPKTDQQP